MQCFICGSETKRDDIWCWICREQIQQYREGEEQMFTNLHRLKDKLKAREVSNVADQFDRNRK